MKQAFTLLLTIILLFGYLNTNAQNQTQKSWNITFETDKYQILSSHHTTLDEVIHFIESLENAPEMVSIIGHTDNVGNFKYNKKLSKRRANAVLEYLTDNGLAKDLVKINGLSYSEPVADNNSDDNRSKNRRTEIVLVYQPNAIQEEITQVEPIDNKIEEVDTSSKTAIIKEQKDDFPEQVVVNFDSAKSFKYRCGQHIKLWSNRGIEILIDGSAVKGCIDNMNINFEITPAISHKEIIQTRASTRSGRKDLRSAGMVFIRLYNDAGRSLNINGCSSVFFEAAEIKGMEAYIATNVNLRALNRVNWRLRRNQLTYDNVRNGYFISYCGYWGRGFGYNGDCNGSTFGDEVITKIRRSNKKTPPSMVHNDGSITNLYPFYQGKNRFKKWLYRNYYYFPISDQSVIQGDYAKVKNPVNNYKINKKVKFKYKKNGKIRGLVKRRMNGRKVYKYKTRRFKYKRKSQKT